MSDARPTTLKLDIADGIAVITLDRAEKMNAFNSVMMRDLLGAFDRIDADDAVRAVIVTGAGRAFCAGADLDEGFGAGAREGDEFRDRGGTVALRIRACLKPVIGVVNGAAAGVGATMLLAMDLRIATPTARFLFPYTRIGMVPEGCASWLLPRLVGPARALEWTLWGEAVSADDACAAGLVKTVLPPGEAMAYARRRATEIVERTSPVAVALTRQMIWAGQSAPDPAEIHLIESRMVAQRRISADVAEGVAALRDKRLPAFPGRVSEGLPSLTASPDARVAPTHAAVIRPSAANRGEAVALRDAHRALGWDEVEDLTARAAAAIRRDITPGRRLGVFARNAIEPALGYVAGLRAATSPVPINFHLTPSECAYILADADVGILLTGPETLDVALAAAAQAGTPLVVGWRCPARPGVVAWEDWLAARPHREPLDLPPRRYLHYTSGTTGQPKGAETPVSLFPEVGTVADLFAAYRAVVNDLPAGPSMIVGPMYHTGPLNSVRHLIGGKPLLVVERFDAMEVLRLVERHRVSTTTLVPTHFQRLLALPEHVRAAHDVSSLRAVNHTGAACPAEVKRSMIDWFGPVFTESYGATEVGSMAMITSAEWLARPGSVGKAQPGFEALVLDDHGQALDRGQTGRLFFRDLSGRGIVYHNAPDKTQAAHIAPGVFTLGDIGHVDADGYIYITDRESDMIVSGGVNIYPAEIEAVLSGHPDVADCAVIGVPDAMMGEAVKALVIPATGRTPDPTVLLQYCRTHLAGYKCPRSIDLVADVGRNAMGKVNKRQLRAPFWPSQRTIGG
jgi:acyl-CoA synthetase (AMP-forming)/AMP-acid ligase II/enoyl-CoA hydratase/carnithine racemase